MLPKEKIEPLDMLEYQRLILLAIKHDHEIKELPNFTDSELQNNFYTCNEFPSGIKITKFISKQIYDSDKRIDFFSKLRTSDINYYIDSDPVALTGMYREIGTCLSPGGENQHGMFQLLFSPYAYIAYDRGKSVRMLIFADDEKKVVFLNQVYGNFDEMFAFSIIKHYINKGYRFLNEIDNYFSDESKFYKDSHYTQYLTNISLMGGSFFVNIHDEYVDIHSRPKWVKFKGDGATGAERGELLTTYESFETTYYCELCGNEHYDEDYDFEQDCCYDCNQTYCDSCGGFFNHEEFNFHYDVCSDCVPLIKAIMAEKEEEKLNCLNEGI